MPKKNKEPDLFTQTGERYPHLGYLRKGPDPRMKEYLANLKIAVQDGDQERILWVLCAGVWWLTKEQAVEVAGVLGKMLDDTTTIS